VTREAESARLKLDRAVEHIDAVEVFVDQWLAGSDYIIVTATDSKTGLTTARAQVKAGPPARLGVLAGDAVQNMRTALDHCVYWLAESALGELTREVESKLMFPIVGNENSRGVPADGAQIFADVLRRQQLYGVPEKARDFIEAEQPYHWPEPNAYRYHVLWVLHDLNRIDKHRRLATTTAALDLQFLSVPEGVDPRVTFKRAEGLVRDGEELVTYSGAELGVAAFFERAVAFAETTHYATRGVSETLRSLLQRVQWIVSALERLS
jgi:hypothetical protein